MNDAAYPPDRDRRAHTSLERHLTIGPHHYEISASAMGEDELRLLLLGRAPDGGVVTEVTGRIAASDLPAVADALGSTLDGLASLRRRRPASRSTAEESRPKRYPNRGTRWATEDDERLVALFRRGTEEKILMETFGRSRSGIRARLESLGEIEAGSVALRVKQVRGEAQRPGPAPGPWTGRSKPLTREPEGDEPAASRP